MMNQTLRHALRSGRILGLASVILLAGCADKRTDQEYLTAALEYVAAEDIPAALIEVRNALQKNPANAEARFLLGSLQLQRGDAASAEKELSRAVELGYPSASATPPLAQALLALGQHERVLALDTQGLSPEAEATLQVMQARAHLALGERFEASEALERAAALAPDDVLLLTTRAALSAMDGQPDAARRDLDRALAIDVDNVEALSQLGDLEQSARDLEAALEAYSRAVDSEGSGLGERLKRAMVLMQLQRFDEAQQDADRLLAMAPQHPGVNYLQGMLHFYRQDFPKANETLLQVLSTSADIPLANFLLGASYFLQGQLEQAEPHLARFHNRFPDHLPARTLLAAVRINEGKFAVAEQLIRPVVAVMPEETTALNILASALMGRGNTAEAIEVLTQISALTPDSAEAAARLGAGLLASGRQEEGVSALQSAIEINPEFQQADILIALAHLRDGDGEQAIAAARAYQQRNPRSPAPANLLGRIFRELGRNEEAEAAFQRALQLAPKDVAARHNLALMALDAEDVPAAREQYQQILAADGTDLLAMLRLADLSLRSGEIDSGIDLLQRAIAAHPAQIAPRIALARVHLQQRKPELVEAAYQGLPDLQRRNPLVLRTLALAQLSQNELSEASASLELLLEQEPDSAELNQLLAIAFLRQGDAERARQRAERALAIDAEFLPAHAMLARLALGRRDRDAFDQHMTVLRGSGIDDAEMTSLEGFAANWDGDAERARSLFAEAFEREPTTERMLTLATQLFQLERREESQALQEAWVRERPDDLRARAALSDFFHFTDQRDAQLESYREILQRDPDNVVALNNLAWYLADKQPADALRYAERAAQRAPEVPAVLDTLAMVQLRNNQSARAVDTVNRVLQLAPKDTSLRYSAAQIMVEAGRPELARDVLRRLLDENPSFEKREEADALMARLQE